MYEKITKEVTQKNKEVQMFLQLKYSELFLTCKELNFSISSIRILINEEFDNVSLKLAESTDFEEIGIPSLEAHMIVDCVKAKFLNEEFDSVSLELAESADFEEIGIPSLHMIVKATFFPSRHAQSQLQSPIPYSSFL